MKSALRPLGRIPSPFFTPSTSTSRLCGSHSSGSPSRRSGMRQCDSHRHPLRLREPRQDLAAARVPLHRGLQVDAADVEDRNGRGHRPAYGAARAERQALIFPPCQHPLGHRHARTEHPPMPQRPRRRRHPEQAGAGRSVRCAPAGASAQSTITPPAYRAVPRPYPTDPCAGRAARGSPTPPSRTRTRTSPNPGRSVGGPSPCGGVCATPSTSAARRPPACLPSPVRCVRARGGRGERPRRQACRRQRSPDRKWPPCPDHPCSRRRNATGPRAVARAVEERSPERSAAWASHGAPATG